MPSLLLNSLTPRPSHHGQALAWLWLFYRDPAAFQKALQATPGKRRQAEKTLLLYLHALPWLILAAALGKWLLLLLVGPAKEASFPLAAAPLYWEFWWSLLFGLAVGLAFGLAFGLAVGLAVGLAGGLAGGLAVGLAGFLGLTRFYYLPWHFLLLWPRPRGRRYPWHPVAWDRMCGVGFPGLDRLLAAYWELEPQKARAEIDRLLDEYPSQRKYALTALAVVVLRQAGRESDLSRLPQLLASLPSGNEGYLAQTAQLAEQAEPLARGYRVWQAKGNPPPKAGGRPGPAPGDRELCRPHKRLCPAPGRGTAGRRPPVARGRPGPCGPGPAGPGQGSDNQLLPHRQPPGPPARRLCKTGPGFGPPARPPGPAGPGGEPAPFGAAAHRQELPGPEPGAQ